MIRCRLHHMVPMLIVFFGPIPIDVSYSGPENNTEKTVVLAPESGDCLGVAQQKCYKIREIDDKDWKLFYGDIEGFAFEPGYDDTLRIREQSVSNPSTDASSIRWILVEVQSKQRAQNPTSSALTDTTWTLVAFIAGDRETLEVEKGVITLTFGALDQMTGHGGCNRFFGRYEVGEDDTLELGPIGATSMACPPPILDREGLFLKALEDVRSFTVKGDRLRLHLTKEEHTLLFETWIEELP